MRENKIVKKCAQCRFYEFLGVDEDQKSRKKFRYGKCPIFTIFTKVRNKEGQVVGKKPDFDPTTSQELCPHMNTKEKPFFVVWGDGPACSQAKPRFS